LAQSTELTLRLRPELVASLGELAGVTRRSRAELAEEALAQYLDVQGWQVEGIRAAIEEADRGEPGVAHERVATWLDSWGSDTSRHRRSPIGSLPCASSGAVWRSTTSLRVYR
jgi:RHH-type rel operon transcriptional repressor/antitoxin RelB